MELAFSRLRTFLHTAQARTRHALADAVRAALDWVSETDTHNFSPL